MCKTKNEIKEGVENLDKYVTRRVCRGRRRAKEKRKSESKNISKARKKEDKKSSKEEMCFQNVNCVLVTPEFTQFVVFTLTAPMVTVVYVSMLFCIDVFDPIALEHRTIDYNHTLK